MQSSEDLYDEISGYLDFTDDDYVLQFGFTYHGESAVVDRDREKNGWTRKIDSLGTVWKGMLEQVYGRNQGAKIEQIYITLQEGSNADDYLTFSYPAVFYN